MLLMTNKLQQYNVRLLIYLLVITRKVNLQFISHLLYTYKYNRAIVFYCKCSHFRVPLIQIKVQLTTYSYRYFINLIFVLARFEIERKFTLAYALELESELSSPNNNSFRTTNEQYYNTKGNN